MMLDGLNERQLLFMTVESKALPCSILVGNTYFEYLGFVVVRLHSINVKLKKPCMWHSGREHLLSVGPVVDSTAVLPVNR